MRRTVAMALAALCSRTSPGSSRALRSQRPTRSCTACSMRRCMAATPLPPATGKRLSARTSSPMRSKWWRFRPRAGAANFIRPLLQRVRRSGAPGLRGTLAKSLCSSSSACASVYGRNSTAGGSRAGSKPKRLSGNLLMVMTVSMPPCCRTSGNSSRCCRRPCRKRGSSCAWSSATTTLTGLPEQLSWRRSKEGLRATSSRSRARICRPGGAWCCSSRGAEAELATARRRNSSARRPWSSPADAKQAQLRRTCLMPSSCMKPKTTSVLPVPGGPHTCKAVVETGRDAPPSPRNVQRPKTSSMRAAPKRRNSGKSRTRPVGGTPRSSSWATNSASAGDSCTDSGVLELTSRSLLPCVLTGATTDPLAASGPGAARPAATRRPRGSSTLASESSRPRARLLRGCGLLGGDSSRMAAAACAIVACACLGST
mmetsp:Transcript_69278/g.206275  ORF Transcript_69278/g.206275 Transcript_69278/m.206275 type:complete len:428 (-) Transcript_69278:17-1300(-)